MKNIYNILIILMLTTISCKAQEINYLTKAEYDAIFIDGINWDTVRETKGDVAKMKALFGATVNYKTGTEPSLSIGFWDKGFYFDFEDEGDNGFGLVLIRIHNNQSNFTIKGITITIGDDISKLGLVKISTYKDGKKDIIFDSVEPSDSAIFIEFDQITNKFNQVVSNIITSIEYVVFD